MNITSFDDLLRLANEQLAPQRLLFVFTVAQLPSEPTEEQRARFEAGAGGALTPLMCVDKTPAEVASFIAFCEEASQAGPVWDILFVSSLSGRDGKAPTTEQAQAPLQRMVQAIEAGGIGDFVPFDRRGLPVHFG